MKQKLLLILLFTSLSYAKINDTVFYNSKWIKVEKKQDANYFKIIEFSSKDSTTAIRKIYYNSRKLHSEQKYSNYKKRIENGSYKSWYENNQLKFEFNYIEKKIDGLVTSYWENGNIKRKDNYIEGKFFNGKCFDINGNEITHFDFIIIPEFPGGIQASMKYIAKNYRMPNVEKNLIGKIIASFEIDLDGGFQNIEILQSLELTFDNEYLRTLYNMPKWSPCMIENKPTYFDFTLPLSINISSE